MTDKRVMHKRALVREVARRTGPTKAPRGDGLTARQVDRALDLLLDVITEEIAAGGAVTIAGFGRFEAIEHAGREVTGLDGETYQVDARLVPSFRAYASLRDKVAGKSDARMTRAPRPIPLRWADDPES